MPRATSFNARKRHPPCVYCGLPGTTKDHVPPKLFLNERPHFKPTTVRACEECNGSLSRDQEYFFVVLAQMTTSPSMHDHMAPGGAIDRIFENSPGLSALIEGQLEVRDDRVWIVPDLGRLGRVAAAVAQGLYSARYGCVAASSAFRLVSVGPTTMVLNGGISIPDFLGLFSERFRAKRWRQVQEGVFKYTFSRDTFRDRLLCFALFHETLLAVVECPNPGRRRLVSRGHLARHRQTVGPVAGA